MRSPTTRPIRTTLIMPTIRSASLGSAAFAATRAAAIELDRAAPRPVVPAAPWRRAPGAPALPSAGGVHGTTQVVAGDADGNLVALITTIGADFGSLVAVPGTGIVLNNSMVNYDPRPGRGNSIAPGKMPFFAVPAIVAARDGKPAFAAAGSGGYAILAGVINTIVGVADHGLSVQAAIDQPRVHSQGNRTFIDARAEAQVRERLAELGHELVVQDVTPGELPFSRVERDRGAGRRDHGRCRAGLDDRRRRPVTTARASPGDRSGVDPARGRHAVVRADLAAGDAERATRCRRSSSTCPTARTTSRAVEDALHPPVLRRPRLRLRARRHPRQRRLRRRAAWTSTRGQEHDDALEVIAWIAAQPWCTGAVGMMGISWSGFNSLQVAARRPPALRAIITACSTDDRYDNDVHYIGGVPLGYYLLPWASVMLAFNARPPDPAIVGERWRELWLERLDGNVDLIEPWLEHQARDDYWRAGSICEDYARDRVRGARRRRLGRCVRRRDLPDARAPVMPAPGAGRPVGPPVAAGRAGPARRSASFRRPSRWWDHWLKGIDNRVMDEPMLRAWMQESVAPQTDYAERPGRWVAEPAWPPVDDSLEPLRLELDERGLRAVSAAPRGGQAELRHCSPQTVGLSAGAWCAYGNPADLPADQRRDDALSLSSTAPRCRSGSSCSAVPRCSCASPATNRTRSSSRACATSRRTEARR